MSLITKIRCGIWFRGASTDKGENFAAKHLKSRGYKIIIQNYNVGFAEIDIIARKGDVLCFVEVKQRASTLFGLPREAVGSMKQAKIRRAAQHYLQKNKENCSLRFDVIEVYGICDGKQMPRIEHIKNAF